MFYGILIVSLNMVKSFVSTKRMKITSQDEVNYGIEIHLPVSTENEANNEVVILRRAHLN